MAAQSIGKSHAAQLAHNGELGIKTVHTRCLLDALGGEATLCLSVGKLPALSNIFMRAVKDNLQSWPSELKLL